MRIVSKRPTTKHANEQANGIRPVSASPAPTPSMFDSAMPRLNARPGYFLAKFTVMVDFDRSASRVTIRSSRAPRSRSASPNAARLANGGDRLGRLGRLAVPLRIVLHEGHALALHGVRHHEGGLASRGLCLVERLRDLADVVAVDLDHRPAEGLPLRDDRLDVEHLLHEVVELDLVPVEKDHEVVEGVVRLAELRRRHRGLPHLAFLDLAVAQDAVDPRGGAGQLEPERQTERDRQPLAERAGRGLDAGQRGPIGMPLERRAELAKRDERLLREIAGLRQHGVERGDRVTLREHDAVPVRPVRTPGIVPETSEEERDEDVDHRERAAGMPGARVGEHAEDLNTTLARDRLETYFSHQSSSSMNPAISSTRTPVTATSGAYTTSSAAQTIVPFTSRVMPAMLFRNVAMLSLIRTALALSGAANRPSRMI